MGYLESHDGDRGGRHPRCLGGGLAGDAGAGAVRYHRSRLWGLFATGLGLAPALLMLAMMLVYGIIPRLVYDRLDR